MRLILPAPSCNSWTFNFSITFLGSAAIEESSSASAGDENQGEEEIVSIVTTSIEVVDVVASFRPSFFIGVVNDLQYNAESNRIDMIRRSTVLSCCDTTMLNKVILI